MAARDELAICEICKQGRVTKRVEEMAFRQWSDKGYIHCRVTVLVGTCDKCRVKSLDPGSDKILDEASTGIRQVAVMTWRALSVGRATRPGKPPSPFKNYSSKS